MNEPPKKVDGSSTSEGQSEIEADPDHLAEIEAKLVQGLQRALADGRLDVETFGHLDVNEFARRLASRSRATERRHARISQWMTRLDRRMRQVESCLVALTRRMADQQESIRMICATLQDLDDPYGFGLSLDERIACDRSDESSDVEG
jgi:phage shock protein A